MKSDRQQVHLTYLIYCDYADTVLLSVRVCPTFIYRIVNMSLPSYIDLRH
jgi:hypothetical protein